MKKFKKFIVSFLATIIVGINLFFNNPTLAFKDIADDKYAIHIANESIYLYCLSDNEFDDKK